MSEELERLAKVCRDHGPKEGLRTLDCTLLKSWLEQQAEIKKLKVQVAANEADIELGKHRSQAVAYVTGRINRLQTEGFLLQTVLVQASMDYDAILEARATKPVAFDIVSTLFLAALPELKVIGRAASYFLPKRSLKAVVSKTKRHGGDNFADFLKDLEQVNQALDKVDRQEVGKHVARTFAQSLDNQAKDIIEAIKDPLATNADIDEQTKRKFQAYHAKNQILSAAIDEIRRTLVTANMVEEICHKFIFWYRGRNLLVQVKSLFEQNGLENDPKYTGDEFNLLREVVLYDMLRVYVSNFVRVDGRSHTSIDEMPSRWSDDYIEGLDEAQRQLIYDRFGTVPWNDQTRPPVNNYKDLVKRWKGKAKLSPIGAYDVKIGQRR